MRSRSENIKTAGEIVLKCDTGRTELHSVEAGSISSKGSTGSLLLKYVTVERKIEVERSTGDVTLTSARAGNFDIETSTGDVKLNSSDAETIEITTSTGDVEGSLLTPKTFSAETDTGRVRVPQNGEGGICKIKTDTGSITITID